MGLAHHIAEWSLDPNKKVGAVIVKDNRILSQGYNGFPSRVRHLPERLQKPSKLDYIVHGEMNAITTAARMGHSLKDSTIYATFFPCPSCAGAIIQAGIKEIVTYKAPTDSSWSEKMKISLQMFHEAGIQIVYVEADRGITITKHEKGKYGN